MNKEQILDDRILIVRRIIKNLRKYGNIEPPGFQGFPVHGTGNDIIAMSKANFLRIAAYLKQDSSKDIHYISSYEANSLLLKNKKDSRPVYLENWTRNANNEYNVSLVPYYNIDELIGKNKVIDNLKNSNGKPSNNPIECYKNLLNFINVEDISLSINESNISEKFKDKIFHKISNIVVNDDKNEITAKFFAMMVMKLHNLNKSNWDNPLYTKQEIETFEKNPQLLIDTVNQAFNFLKKYTKVNSNNEYKKTNSITNNDILDKNINDYLKEQFNFNKSELANVTFSELQNRIAAGIKFTDCIGINKHDIFRNAYVIENIITKLAEITNQDISKLFNKIQRNSSVNNITDNDLFKNLEIELLYTDTPLLDPQGIPYTENITLNGIYAYELLVMLNAMDKSRFSNNDISLCGDGKTSIKFSYNGYNHSNGESIRIDLGDLEFGNKKTITEALKYRLNLYRMNLLKFNNACYLNDALKDDETNMSIDEARIILTKEISEVNKLLDSFAIDENKYLSMHPKIKKINEQDANPYIYVCKKSDYNGIISDRTIEKTPNNALHNYCIMPVGNSFTSKIDDLGILNDNTVNESNFAIRDGLPDNMMAIYASSCPQYMKENEFEACKCALAMPADDIKTIKELNKISITVEDNEYGYIDSAKNLYSITGVDALKWLRDLKKTDARNYLEICKQGYFTPQNNRKYHITILYDDKVLDKINFIEGTGKLAKRNIFPFEHDVRTKINMYLHYINENWYLLRDLQEPTYDVICFEKHYKDTYHKDVNLPTVAESIAKWNELSPEPAIPRRGDYEYYIKCHDTFMTYGCIDTQNDTFEKICKAAIMRMADTGRNVNQINTIIKNIARFDKKTSAWMAKAIKLPDVLKYIKNKSVVISK